LKRFEVGGCAPSLPRLRSLWVAIST
jgi:hypothetical protein